MSERVHWSGERVRLALPEEWPGLLDPGDDRLVVARLTTVARDAAEGRAFLQAWSRAKAATDELEALFALVPHVLAGDPAADGRFREQLDLAAEAWLGGVDPRDVIGITPFPDPPGGETPCQPRFFVHADRIAWIASAVERVAGHDQRALERHVAVLDAMWRGTEPLDRIFEASARGPGDAPGHDPLRGFARKLVRDLDRQPPPPVGGRGPGGIPIGPPRVDLCRWQREVCRQLIVGGVAGLGGIVGAGGKPQSTNASGITGIQPQAACSGDVISILGSGFGSQRPAHITVLIGNRPAEVVSWTDTKIEIRVPVDARAGCVGFRDEQLEAQRFESHSRAQESAAQLSEGYACLGKGVLFPEVPYIPAVPPCTTYNYFAGTGPEIDYFRVNGVTNIGVDPGTALTLSWNVRNAQHVRVRRISSAGPHVDRLDPPGTTLALGTWQGTQPAEAIYELTATNACGTVTARVHVRLRRIPALVIEGMEITQGIQTFWRQGVAWNSLATIAGKDTIVRVYVSVDLLGFQGDEVRNVTGTLSVGGTTLSPINGITPTTPAGTPFITARRRDRIDRTRTNHTLNFRIPAALAQGTRSLTITVRAPAVDGRVPQATRTQSWTWRNETALRVRFVRIRDDRPNTGTGTRPTAAEARFTVERAFDLLPSPPTDIAPAWQPLWGTTRNFTTLAGLSGLLGDLDDEHDCSAWEWLWAWTGTVECPADDHAIWICMTTPFNRGLAGTPGNTCIAAIHTVAGGQGEIQRTTPAHELSHNLGFLHVNRACRTATIGGPFYAHPNNGDLQDVPFDPFWNTAIGGTVQDFMSYGCTVWTSADSWARLRGVI